MAYKSLHDPDSKFQPAWKGKKHETDLRNFALDWMATAEIPARPALMEDAHANVCVVGAGIAGMTTAYLLAQEGKSVVVLDDGPIGGGMTGGTTAHLVTALDDRYFELERLHGEDGARLAARSHAASINRVEQNVTEEKIDCDFERVDGYLFVPPGESKEILDRELEATHRAGLNDVSVPAKPWRAIWLADAHPLSSFL